MRELRLGAVLPIMQAADGRHVPSGQDIIAQARRAEELGFDTIWAPDELLWQVEDQPPRGAWDGVAVLGAVAAVTSRPSVGAWALSALHRNPGILAKTAETLDALSGGRFIFGLGAGTCGSWSSPRVRAARGRHLRPVRGSAPDHRPATPAGPGRLPRHLPRGQ